MAAAIEMLSAPTPKVPYILAFFEVRDPEPGVVVRAATDLGEMTTHYPESAGWINSYSDSCSD